MQVRSAAEALFIACEMEKRAIRLYERALEVFTDGPCQEAMHAILSDEKRHLARFTEMGGEAPDFERARLLAAQAAEVLFSGGLVEAQRKGAFDSVLRLYQYAAEEEKNAAESYGAFAAQLSGPAAAAFRQIKTEETGHLQKLNEMICAFAGQTADGAENKEKDSIT
ncbi:MAG: hypothetical protein IKH30_12435 [Clostridia bacterium]|nr:hypothetical protein [Clostridia bacterium]